MAKEKKYNFGEQEFEYIDGNKIPVSQTSKYVYAKEKVIELLESKEYGNVLNEGDFWILKNTNKNKSAMYYSGLIINHDALIKINDILPSDYQFNEMYCSDPIETNWNGTAGLRMDYRDKRDGMFEYGEISLANCKNAYPYAMLLKRTFDRVVKRKAKLSCVYSDSEAEEFKEQIDNPAPVIEKKYPKIIEEQAKIIIDNKDLVKEELKAKNIKGKKDLSEISIKEASDLCKLIDERIANEKK